MANPRRGEVDVELGGQPYTLVYDFNALSEIEAAFGDKSIDELFFAGNMSRRVLREAIRVGLERKYRKHTPKQVGRMIGATLERDPKALAGLARAVVCGLLAASGVPAERIEQINRVLSGDEDAEAADEKACADDPPPTAAGTGAA